MRAPGKKRGLGEKLGKHCDQDWSTAGNLETSLHCVTEREFSIHARADVELPPFKWNDGWPIRTHVFEPLQKHLLSLRVTLVRQNGSQIRVLLADVSTVDWHSDLFQK